MSHIQVVDLNVAVSKLASTPADMGNLKKYAAQLMEATEPEDLRYLIGAILELIIPTDWSEPTSLEELLNNSEHPPVRRVVLRLPKD